MKRKKRNLIIVLTFTLFLLMGCSSDPNIETKEEIAEMTEQSTEAVETAEIKATAEPSAQPTAEPTPTPTMEPVVYEGIDMESILPGREWIISFAGILDEPKLIVFNDETNKKIIIEEGQEVIVDKTDTLAAYTPSLDVYVDNVDYLPITKLYSDSNYYTEIKIDWTYFVTKNMCAVTFFSEEDITINCLLIPGES